MQKKVHKCLILVEATGLEPTTFWSLTKRATKLRYASILLIAGFPALRHKQLYSMPSF